VDRLGEVLNRVGEEVIIGADVNAHSDLWYSRANNNTGRARGTHVKSLISEMNLVIHNGSGFQDTYERLGMGSSNIDVTLTRGADLDTSIRDWSVIEGVTDSDHKVIKFYIKISRSTPTRTTNRTRCNMRRAD